jgi:hypothetical protein
MSFLLWFAPLAILVTSLLVWERHHGVEASVPEARDVGCSSCNARHSRMVEMQAERKKLKAAAGELRSTH